MTNILGERCTLSALNGAVPGDLGTRLYFHCANLHSCQVKVIPELFKEIIEVPLMMRRYGNTVRNLIDDIEFLDKKITENVSENASFETAGCNLDRR